MPKETRAWIPSVAGISGSCQGLDLIEPKPSRKAPIPEFFSKESACGGFKCIHKW